jgi:hypothetical protein
MKSAPERASRIRTPKTSSLTRRREPPADWPGGKMPHRKDRQMTAVQDRAVSFNWTVDRAVSCKALIEGRGVSDKQIADLKTRFAQLVQEIIPGRYATVGATVAERGTRTWVQNGDKIKIGTEEGGEEE